MARPEGFEPPTLRSEVVSDPELCKPTEGKPVFTGFSPLRFRLNLSHFIPVWKQGWKQSTTLSRVAATCGARRRRKEAFERHGPTADESPSLRAIRYREAKAPRVKAVETRAGVELALNHSRSATVLQNLAGSMTM